MTDENRVRRALDYEIDPWTPDPEVLMRGGRRIAWARRGAAATAALAVAVTVAGVAAAVGGVTAAEPPVAAGSTPSAVPSVPSNAPSAVPTAMRPSLRIPEGRWICPRPLRSPTAQPSNAPTPRLTSRPTATPSRVSKPPRAQASPRMPRVEPSPMPTPGTPNPSGCVRVGDPTTPVPTSVPAGR